MVFEKVKNIVKSRFEGKTPKAFVHTYGCQGNVADSEHIKGQLVEMGYVMTETLEEADIIIYNTCAIREHAEDRVFGNVGALKTLKKNNKNLIIGLCGCMMQQEHVAEKIKNIINMNNLFLPFLKDKFGNGIILEFLYIPQILNNPS